MAHQGESELALEPVLDDLAIKLVANDTSIALAYRPYKARGFPAEGTCDYSLGWS